ncbi:MAG: hypothetical protein WAN05_28210, partial [Roseiarcus sp.]
KGLCDRSASAYGNVPCESTRCFTSSAGGLKMLVFFVGVAVGFLLSLGLQLAFIIWASGGGP